MTTRYNILYDVPPEEFDLSEQRFKKISVVSMLGIRTEASSNRNTVNTDTVQQAFQILDMLTSRDFYSPVPCFSDGTLGQDLNLEQVVEHLIRPRFTPLFQRQVLEHTPFDINTTHYRQAGLHELITKPAVAKGLEDGIELFAQLVCSIFNRAYAMKHELHWNHSRRQQLKILAPYNLAILQRYTAMVQHFTKTLEGAESKPMRRLWQYFEDLRRSPFFNDVFPTFDVSYFKDNRITLEVTIGRNGVLTGSEYRGAERASRIPAFKLISHSLGFVSAFFKMLCLPSTFAMDAMNTVVQSNIDSLLKTAEMIGPMEFYTSGASFYRRMQEIGMPVQLPTVLPKEERRTHLPNARNPLLLYQKGEDEHNVSRVIPNDIRHDAEQNLFVITGSNNGGKTCYVKTCGLMQLLGQNGLPITAEGKQFEAYLSVVDGIYTHFVSPDDIMAGEGRLKNELRRVEQIYRAATPYSLVIMDEPCGGTEHSEGARQSLVILDGLHTLGCAVYFTTHLHEVADVVDINRYSAGKNLHVEILENPETKGLVRTYRVLPGKATSSYGTEVAKSIGLTDEGIAAIIEQRAATGAFDKSLLRDRIIKEV